MGEGVTVQVRDCATLSMKNVYLTYLRSEPLDNQHEVKKATVNELLSEQPLDLLDHEKSKISNVIVFLQHHER